MTPWVDFETLFFFFLVDVMKHSSWKPNLTGFFFWLLPVNLCPPEEPLASLTLTPNSRQVYTGQRFTLGCPQARANSSGWMLRRFSPGRRVRKRVLRTDACSPLGGAVGADASDTCTFTAASENAGLYWCEGADGRSNAIHITVSSESPDNQLCWDETLGENTHF